LPTPSLSTSQPEDLLGRVRIASPCVADWEKMTGDDRIRHCPQCNLSVYNLSGMTAREAAHLIYSRQGRLCVRFYRRTNGTMLTQDSSPMRRGSRLAAAALSAAITVSLAAAQTAPQPGSPPLVQIDELESGIVVQVTDQMDAIVANAKVSLMNQSTKREWAGATNASGNLRLAHLPAGIYSMTVSSPGFGSEKRSVITGERQIAHVKVTLRLAAVMGGLVEVTAAMGVVDVQSSADIAPIPLIPVTTSLAGGPFLPGIPGSKPRSKSIFTRFWHKLGF